MERLIKVTGKGRINVKPDMIRLCITQQSTEKTYDAAVKASAEQKTLLTNALCKLGFEKTDLKTLYFNVDTENESYQDEDKAWKCRLVGYRFTHRMKLEFSVESGLLGKVLAKLTRGVGNPEFNIEYTVSDPEAAKNELLAKAVSDSKAKAEVLTRAAGVELGEIVNIDYSWGEVDFYTRPMNNMSVMKCYSTECEDEEDDMDFDIDAEDIKAEDTVTVIWQII